MYLIKCNKFQQNISCGFSGKTGFMGGDLHKTVVIETDLSLPPSKEQNRIKKTILITTISNMYLIKCDKFQQNISCGFSGKMGFMSGDIHNTVVFKTDLSLPPYKEQNRMKTILITTISNMYLIKCNKFQQNISCGFSGKTGFMSGDLHKTVVIKTDLSLPPSKEQNRMKNNSYYNYLQHVSNQMQQISAKYLMWFFWKNGVYEWRLTQDSSNQN